MNTSATRIAVLCKIPRADTLRLSRQRASTASLHSHTWGLVLHTALQQFGACHTYIESVWS